MPEIKIKIGASVDQNLANVFRPVADAAARARKVVDAETKAAGKATGDNLKDGANRADKEFEKLVSELQKGGAGMMKPATAAVVQFGKEAKANFGQVKREFDEMARQASRALKKTEQDAARAGLGLGGSGNTSTSSRARPTFRNGPSPRSHQREIITGVSAGLRTSLGIGKRIAGDTLQGLGVNTNVAAQLQGSVSRESLAAQISNSSFIPEGGPEGSNQRVAAGDILSDVRKTANATALDQTDLLQGLQAFVGKTGDLKTGREAMTDLAKLSKATGTNMADMLDAAASVDNQLGDIPHKAEVINQTMRAIAGQGQLGAIEIRDMAHQMSKLAAQAGKFQLDAGTRGILESKGLTNSTSQNVAVMGALSQAAMAHGGRGTAGTAAQSSMAFIRDLSSRTELKRMSAAGIDVFADKEKTIAKDPKEIIQSVLAIAARSSKGFQPEIANLLPNQNSRAVVGAFGQTFQSTYQRKVDENGDAIAEQERMRRAVAAVNDEYDKYLRVTMSVNEIQEKFALAMATTESRAQIVNNKLAETSDQLKDALIPAFVALAPALIGLASGIATATGKITGTDGKAEAEDLEKTRGKAARAAMLLEDSAATGQLPEGAAQLALDRKSALEAAIKNKEKDVAEKEAIAARARDSWTGRAIDWAGSKALGTRTNVDVREEDARNARSDLERSKETDEQLVRALEQINRSLTGQGLLSVKVIGSNPLPPANPAARPSPAATQ